MNRPGGRTTRWTASAIAILALVVAVTTLTSSPDDARTTTTARAPVSDPDGDPAAQCRVLALGALEMLAKEDATVLADLDAEPSRSTAFIASIVRRHQAAFLAEAHRSGPIQARHEFAPEIKGDCLRAPA